MRHLRRHARGPTPLPELAVWEVVYGESEVFALTGKLFGTGEQVGGLRAPTTTERIADRGRRGVLQAAAFSSLA